MLSLSIPVSPLLLLFPFDLILCPFLTFPSLTSALAKIFRATIMKPAYYLYLQLGRLMSLGEGHRPLSQVRCSPFEMQRLPVGICR